MEKLCKTCEIIKPFSDYHKAAKGKYGIQNECKLCIQVRSKRRNLEKKSELNKKCLDYYYKNLEKRKEYSRKYIKENREEINKNNKIRYHEKGGKEHSRNYHLIRTYGISLEDYNNMFEEQNGKCSICKIDNSLLKKDLAVDHCHKTEKVRSLLCGNCNLGLGSFQDSIEFMEEAIVYLKKHNK